MGMTNDQQVLITNWQLCAAILMGIEYFLPKNIKEIADAKFGEYLKGVEGRVDHDLMASLKDIWQEKIKLTLSVFFIAMSYLVFTTLHALHNFDAPLFSTFIILVGVFFFSGGFLTAMQIVFPRLLLICYGLPIRILAGLIRVCPKGPVAAAGLLCLAISFALRYMYLT